MVTALTIKACFLALLIGALTGCGMTIGGTKEAPWVKIPDGFAFSVGVNNIDHVVDRKGLNVERKAERY